jgi:hypothetical protein
MPHTTITMDRTQAKTGRSMKNRDMALLQPNLVIQRRRSNSRTVTVHGLRGDERSKL